MLIQGPVGKERAQIFIEKCVEAAKSLCAGEKMIVLLLNSYQKAKFAREFVLKYPNYASNQIKIYTLYGLCYNAFKDNESYVKRFIKCDEGENLNLCGLEVSQYIFKQSIKEADFSDYISKVNLLHQLFRRYSLIVHNKLTEKEVFRRSRMLNETFCEEAQKAIEDYRLKTIKYKSFDYLRQIAVLPFIFKNTDYFNDVKYLACDDADEYSYAFWSFIYDIVPGLKDYIISYDGNGSSRAGYLCAYKNGARLFKEKFKPSEIRLKDNLTGEYASFTKAVLTGTKVKLKTVKHFGCVSRRNMSEKLLSDIKQLVSSGVKPSEISVISPICDKDFEGALKDNGDNIKFRIVSGSEKFTDLKVTGCIIILLKLVNDIDLKPFELHKLFLGFLKIPYDKCRDVLEGFETEKVLKEYSFENPSYAEKYSKTLNLINSLKISRNKASEQIKIIYENLIKPYSDDEEKTKYAFLLKEAIGFETAFSDTVQNPVKEFVIQTENSIISENPSETISFQGDEVLVSTPAKAVDYMINCKYSFWADVSSGEWLKDDSGTLYNAVVFNRDFDKKEYTYEDEIKFIRDKTVRIIRKLMMLPSEKISFYSSMYNAEGRENTGGLCDYFEVEAEEKPVFKITPREDQKKVLEYKKGEAGVTAVPGAGKTTILTALTVKLIESGVNPEKIYILTFMESAAKTFRERIKSALTNNSPLPNVYTIHGLAYRIIKDNGNFKLCGLDENFDICYDALKDEIIAEISKKMNIPAETEELYVKCLAAVKSVMPEGKLVSKYKEIKDFYDFTEEYNKILKTRNLTDYDDMLRYAVKILEDNPEIRDYYADNHLYIIEDEAQDSTDIQQRLINLLKSKHGNYLRCGDINQSITSTFTNSNLENFKKFISEHSKTEMNTSQRSAKPIYTLANLLIKEAKKNPETANAFYDLEMKGTDKNPQAEEIPVYNAFDTEKEEKNFILSKIKEIKRKFPRASIALLLRLNSQAGEYAEFLNANNIKTQLNTDCLSQNKMYKIIREILTFRSKPDDNKTVLNIARLYSEMNIRKFNSEEYSYIERCEKPFINVNAEDTGSENLLQLFWDLNYLLNSLYGSISEMALKTGLFYSSTSDDRSNAYIISLFFNRLNNTDKNYSDLLTAADYYSKKNTSSLKLYDEETTEDKVKVMTVHKSKGDEFDFVFIPGLSEENYPCAKKYARIKSGAHFIQSVKNAIDRCGIKSVDEQKIEQVCENLRLIYVGITRAKKSLYLSWSKNGTKHKNSHSAGILDEVFNNLSR